MEQKKTDGNRISDMVMCGDHPSFTKAELNVKETKSDVKEKEKEKPRFPVTFSKVTPTTSRTEQSDRLRGIGSEQVLRFQDARRRSKPLELRVDANDMRTDIASPVNRALMQTALGSIRWPPYLVLLWVVALVFTHIIHCVVNILEKTLPNLRSFTHYFRTWTEASWRSDKEHRASCFALATVTALLYALYYFLFVIYSLALWATEPLCADEDNEEESKVTNYDEIKG